MKGSGINDALVDSDVFRPHVLESALSGKHYVRALTGMLIVEDLIHSLQWKAFWMSKAKYYPELACVETMQRKISQNSQC